MPRLQHSGGRGRKQEDPRFRIIQDYVVSLRLACSTGDHIESRGSLSSWERRSGSSLILCSHLWNDHMLWLPWKHYHSHFQWLQIKYEAQSMVLQKHLLCPPSLSVDGLSQARAQSFYWMMFFFSVKSLEVHRARYGTTHLQSQQIGGLD